MNHLHFIPQDLIHKKEKVYFVLALIVSLITYIALIVSVIGIIYVGIFIAVSSFLNALMRASVRSNGVRLHPEQFPKVYSKVQELSEKMEIHFVPDVYISESSGTLNAFATRFLAEIWSFLLQQCLN